MLSFFSCFIFLLITFCSIETHIFLEIVKDLKGKWVEGRERDRKSGRKRETFKKKIILAIREGKETEGEGKG